MRLPPLPGPTIAQSAGRSAANTAVDVTVEKTSKTLAKVSFNVEAQEFRKEYENGLRQVGGNTRMKGFRPGKVPLKVLEKAHGENVRRQVREFFLQRAYQQAVQDEKLRPISHPRIELEKLDSSEIGEFALDFEIPLRPEIELGDYSAMKIDSELEPVVEGEVESAIRELRRQQSTPEPAGEEGIDEDGVVMCTVTFLHGENVQLERENLRLSPATPPPGVEPEAFKQALVGTKDGDVVELKMLLPETLDDEAARGQEGVCRLTIAEAYRMVPPSDEDILKLVDVENLEQLNEKVRERLQESKQTRERNRIETALLERLVQETEIELPETLLDEQTDARLKQLHDRMTEQGVEHDEIHKAMDEQRPTAREDASRGLKALLIVETLAEKEELLVTREEMDAEFASIAERNQSTVEEVREYYGRNNLGQQMAIEILERKVRTFLREKAEVREPS